MSFLPEGDRYAFTLNQRVASHDTDSMGRLKLSALLRYVETISTGHLEALDLGHTRLMSEGIVFVLAALAVKIYQQPTMYEELTLKTCPAGYQGAQMIRETALFNQAGHKMAEVQASWVMIDPYRRKPLRGSSFKYPLPTLPDWQPFINPAKLKIAAATTPAIDYPVRYSHLDVNQHMNNTVYADVVMDALPIEEATHRTPDTLLIRLRHETRAGETLDIRRDPTPQGYLISARVAGDTCFEAEIIFKD